MDNNDHKRQQVLLAMMTSKGASSPPDADQLLLPWLRLANHLSPLIGESGFCALYGRTLRLAAPQFEWLTASQASTSTEALFIALREDLVSVDAGVAGPANAALLTTFTKLLSALIGEALTIRLLTSASNGEHEQENVQEHK